MRSIVFLGVNTTDFFGLLPRAVEGAKCIRSLQLIVVTFQKPEVCQGFEM